MKIEPYFDVSIQALRPCLTLILAELDGYRFRHSGKDPACVFMTPKLIGQLVMRESGTFECYADSPRVVRLRGIPVREIVGAGDGPPEFYFSDEEAES